MIKDVGHVLRQTVLAASALRACLKTIRATVPTIYRQFDWIEPYRRSNLPQSAYVRDLAPCL